MYKLLAYWSAPKPEDAEAFEEYYLGTHCPRAAAVPHLRRLTSTRCTDGFEGADPLHYRAVEMVFDDAEAMARSAESEEWTTMRECSGSIIERFGVELTVEAGEEEDFAPTAG